MPPVVTETVLEFVLPAAFSIAEKFVEIRNSPNGNSPWR